MARPKTTDISAALARVLPEERVRRLATSLGVVVRERKVKILPLVWTLALGFQVGHQRSLTGLRQAYEKRAGHTLVASGFYNRLTAKLAGPSNLSGTYPRLAWNESYGFFFQRSLPTQ